MTTMITKMGTVAATILVAGLAPARAAHAWVCQPYYFLDNDSEDHDDRDLCNPSVCRHPPGSTVIYKFLSGDGLSSSERDALQAGAEAWWAGTNRPIEDATFRFARSSSLATSRSFDDANSTVSQEVSSWFTNSNICVADDVSGGDCTGSTTRSLRFTAAVSVTTLTSWASGCNWRATDIVLNGGSTFSTSKTSEIDDPTTTLSYGETALHEFGHSFGLAHDDDGFLDIMDTNRPGAGDTSFRWRV